VVVDRYGEHLVLKLYSTSWIPWLEPLGATLSEALPTRGILVRASRGVERSPLTPDPFRQPTVLQGEVPEALPFLEEGMRFEAHPWVGHKTGFYLDQRENRSLLRKQVTAGAKVLNIFSYTGGFSLAAAMGGALEVTSLDQSGPALAQAERHFQLNRHHAKVGSANHRIMEGDAFEALETLARRGERFDGIIVDPPSFAKDREGSEGGLRQYARLTRLALRILRPGGLLLQASCSSRIGEEAFYRELLRAGESAGRPLREILRTAHPLDHPIRWPESAYLKALLARVP
jgi:23S rRNA (cytosine1962-C5)-methyltransferase